MAFAVGLFAAWKLYANTKTDPLPEKLGALSRAMQNRFYFDELYEATFIRAHDFIATVADWIDRWIVDGLVNAAGMVPSAIGSLMRSLQMGLVQFYALAMVLGALVLVAARLLWAAG